ncbi:MAG: lipopolysaccharide assembly protein LapA domain-containing protein [Burkholderiales bacterium]
MKRVTNLLAWGAVAIVGAFAVLNWSTLTAPAPLNLVIAQVQAPLGVVMLGVAATLAGIFLIASLGNQIGSLLETRRLLKEIQRVQQLADKAEGSRIEGLQRLIATEFGLLNGRLDEMRVPAIVAGGPRVASEPRAVSLAAYHEAKGA